MKWYKIDCILTHWFSLSLQGVRCFVSYPVDNMYSSGRLSRPSSATSFGSRVSQLSHSSQADAELKLECKAAYLSVFDDINDDITKKSDFILGEKCVGICNICKCVLLCWCNLHVYFVGCMKNIFAYIFETLNCLC